MADSAGTGKGVDAGGGPVIDPTANVIALVKAKGESDEKLRANDEKWAGRLERKDERWQVRCGKIKAALFQERKERLEERDRLREELARKEAERLDAKALAESRRVDAIVSEQKAQAALDRAQNQATATALAAQVAQSAEVLRAAAEQQRNAVQQRLEAIDKAMAAGGGEKIGSKDTSASIRGAIMLGLALLSGMIVLLGFLAVKR
jgi:hypothetical protein